MWKKYIGSLLVGMLVLIVSVWVSDFVSWKSSYKMYIAWSISSIGIMLVLYAIVNPYMQIVKRFDSVVMRGIMYVLGLMVLMFLFGFLLLLIPAVTWK